jgi:hypothetical protein
MTEDEVIAYVAGLPEVVVQTAVPGDGSPEIAWGDSFFYYSPEGTVPATQPFATVVTKDYPGDTASRLDRPGAFRVNIGAGRDAVARLREERQDRADDDPGEADALLVHPVYGHLGWLAVVNPGAHTDADTRRLLAEAHANAMARHERRHGDAPD